MLQGHYLLRSTFSQNYNLLLPIKNTFYYKFSYNYYKRRDSNIDKLFFGHYIHMSQLLIVANNNCEDD